MGIRNLLIIKIRNETNRFTRFTAKALLFYPSLGHWDEHLLKLKSLHFDRKLQVGMHVKDDSEQ